jgi:hypothetical protein
MEYIHSSLSEVKEKVEMHLEEDKKHKENIRLDISIIKQQMSSV